MSSLVVLLKAAPEEDQHVNFAWNLARAAREEGHDVSLFAWSDGVYNLTSGIGGEERSLGLPADDGAESGIRYLFCHYNAEERGIADRLAKGASRSATSQVAMLIARSDRCLVITG